MLNAATDSQKDLQIVAEEAKMSGTVVLLLDEIHRLNKVKQDFYYHIWNQAPLF